MLNSSQIVIIIICHFPRNSVVAKMLLTVLLGFSLFLNSDHVHAAAKNAKREADADYNDDINNHHGSSFGRLLNTNQNFQQTLPNNYDDRRKLHQQDRTSSRSRLLRMNRQKGRTSALRRRRLPVVINIQNCYASQCSQVNNGDSSNK